MPQSIYKTFDLFFLQSDILKDIIIHVKNLNDKKQTKDNIVCVNLFSSKTNKKIGYLTLNYHGIRNGTGRNRLGYGYMVLKNKTITIPINVFESHNDSSNIPTFPEKISTTSTVVDHHNSNTYNTTIEVSYDDKEKYSAVVTLYNN